MAGLDERVAAGQVAPLERRQADGDALAGLSVLDGGVVHLDAPHAHDPSRRLEPQQVAGGDRP